MKHAVEVYRGYLWPFLALIGGVTYGIQASTHSYWHYGRVPALAVGMFAALRSQALIRKGKR